MEENVIRINVIQSAMKLGLVFGIFQTVKLALFPLTLQHQIFSLLLMPAVFGSPVILWLIVRRFRESEAAEFFPFIYAWPLTIMTVLFAAVISTVVAYVYLQYVDHGAFVTALAAQIEVSVEAIGQQNPTGEMSAMLSQMDEYLKVLRSMTPIQFSKQVFSILLFWGNIISVIIAAVTARVRLKTKGQ